MTLRALVGWSLALALAGGVFFTSSEAEAAKVVVINTGARTWPVRPIPADVQKLNPMYRQLAQQGGEVAYRCSAFGIFWAYLHWWNCQPVLTLGRRDLLLPASVQTHIARLYPRSTMRMGFWAQHGRWILLALLVGSIAWSALERRRTIVVVHAPRG